MAVAVEDHKGIFSGSGSITLSTLTVTSGNLLIAFVGVGVGGGGDLITDITVDTVSILANLLWTKSDGGFVRTNAYYQKSPSAGTKSIVVTFSATDQRCLQAVSLTGVDVAGTTFGTAATNSGSSATASVAVTSASGFVIGHLASDSEGGITAGGTLIENQGPVASDTFYGVQNYTTTNPTVSWTQSNTGWACGGVGIAASGGGATTWGPLLAFQRNTLETH